MTNIIRYIGEFLKHLVGVALLCWRRMLRAGAIAFAIGLVLALLAAVIITGRAFPGVLPVVVAVLFATALGYGIALTVFLEEFVLGIVDLIKLLEGDVEGVAHITAEIAEREAGDVGHGLRRLLGIQPPPDLSAPLAPKLPTFRNTSARPLQAGVAAAAVAGGAALAARPAPQPAPNPAPNPASPPMWPVAGPVRADQLPRIGWTLEHEAVRPPKPNALATGAAALAGGAAVAAAAEALAKHHTDTPTEPGADTPAEPQEEERLAEPVASTWYDDETPTLPLEGPVAVDEQPTVDTAPGAPADDLLHSAPFIAPAVALPAVTESEPVDVAMLQRAGATNPLSEEMLRRAANTNPLPTMRRPPAPDTHPLPPEETLTPAPSTTPLPLAMAPATTPLPHETLTPASSTTPLLAEFQPNTLDTPLAAVDAWRPTSEQPAGIETPAPASPSTPRTPIVIDPLLGQRSRTTLPLTPEDAAALAVNAASAPAVEASPEPEGVDSAPVESAARVEPAAAAAPAAAVAPAEPVEPDVSQHAEPDFPPSYAQEPPRRSGLARITQPVEGLASHFDTFGLEQTSAPSQRAHVPEGGLWERLSHALSERAGAPPSSPFSAHHIPTGEDEADASPEA